MNIEKSLPALVLLLSGLAFGLPAIAQSDKPDEPAAQSDKPAEPAEPPGLGTEYSEKGADTCMTCHEGWPYPLLPIFKTKHAQRADSRTPFATHPSTPFAGLQCEACHGPGPKHAASTDKNAINSFKETSFLSPRERNKFCLECHSGGARLGWPGSTHDSNDVACTRCHRIHAERDLVRETSTQAEICFNCHRKERADFQKPSTHPVRAGKMACSECHSPHGSNSRAMLVKSTVNQTCYTCHAEKRGPFLWEHAPVAEDCTLCHTPHGSARPTMLAKTPPLLCQQCHSTQSHNAVAYTGTALPGGSAPGAAAYLLAGGCTNCHSQVHGSNHPSGYKLMR